MASKSRAAQEKLAELEKDSAPFAEQLVEAAKFIGADLDYIDRSGIVRDDSEKPKLPAFHGKEEWLLRWLLKKLQSQKDAIPRKSPSAWRLLCHILQTIPVVAAARILQERKFMSILYQTLEEAQVTGTSRDTAPSDPEEASAKASRKRKRSGELVIDTANNDHGLGGLLEAIHAVITYMQLSTTYTAVDGRGAEFSAEAMRSVLRTTAEEAAKILGLWLAVSRILLSQNSFQKLIGGKWLSRFVHIWELHTPGIEDLMQFSLYCSQSLIALLQAVKSGQVANISWVPVLEELVARNIMLPAKAARADDAESDLLGVLTRVSIIRDSANAPLQFEIAIRSIQPQGSKRRRLEDETWLQAVFNTFVEAMLPARYVQNSEAIRCMLQSAINHKVGLELSVLRSITLKYALPERSPNWELLHTLILLDANIFLIPDGEKSLLEEVLTRVTVASLEPSWPEISRQVVLDVVLPLMNESANARDLSGFIRHWYAQLVEFEKLRNVKGLSTVAFSAWEDEALQLQLSKLLEPSLTLRQIIEILDFLEEQDLETSNAMCVILEAIAGSITREEVVDSVQLRLYHIMFDNNRSDNLAERYDWRSWRILTRTLSWATNSEIEQIASLWKERAQPFDIFSEPGASIPSKDGSLFDVDDEKTADLGDLECFRAGCAAWEKAEEWSPLKELAKTAMLESLRLLTRDVKSHLRSLRKERPVGEEVCGSSLNTERRGVGWMVWSCLRCVFVDYPTVLELGLKLPGNAFREMLQNVFWIASSSPAGVSSSPHPWLQTNPDAFPNLWVSALLSPVIQNNEALLGQMIDIMLLSENSAENPLILSPGTNAFAVRSLLKVPLDFFSRRDRKRVTQGWLQAPKARTHRRKKKNFSTGVKEDVPQTFYELTALNPEVLSLKVKIMQLPTSYEGMKFEDLVGLADALAHPKSAVANPRVNLAEFKKYAELTLVHMTANLDQPRSQEYVSDAISHIKRKCPSSGGKVKGEHSWDYASTALLQVVLSTLSTKEPSLDKRGILSSGDLNGIADSYRSSLLAQLRSLLKMPANLANTGCESETCLELLAIVDALSTLGVDGTKLIELFDDAKSFITSLTEEKHEVAYRLKIFIAAHARDGDGDLLDTELKGDTSSTYGRKGIVEKATALTTERSQQDKLDLLKETFGENLVGLSQLDKLLAAKHIISSCKATRPESDGDEDAFDLSRAYFMLCGQLRKATSVRQFLLLGEIMEMMLRTKGRSISQWNIDSTLGSIAILCSRNSPSLRSARAGSIYLRLCHLLQAVLTDHRLKLQGHFHLVVQCMQALLRCLFTPLPHTSARSAKFFAPPPWVSSNPLKAAHAAAFTRLVTSICDPSISSVTRSQHNNLKSATDKAKRMAGQYMQFLLLTYIKMQLEMKMLPEVREKMSPGLYAIFDTTTPELRRMVSDSLDSSGRAVFSGLYRDYLRFGKWNGS